MTGYSQRILVNVSSGRVRCSIAGDEPLPIAAYAVVATLAEAVLAADRALKELKAKEES